ncbi:hypothetical protein Poli38472_001482 [Pythium oligandrum]|uniref:Lipoprotein n=1 Tax=Pythium oligandrum TaxID=41045 RepID=A0A8K1CVD9_PYTOL|nr:hypothetical protein Poli38472_001482 [Pythium oligandrum]|eukprot:TMW69326.1 hypothetical protein Poli38472_001482 [Pythium oligandrum]
MCRLVTVVMLALLGCYPDQGVVQAALSIPKASDATGPRAAGIAALHAAIQNEPRTISIGDQEFPFYNGPIPRPDSLAEKIRLEEAAALTGNQTQLVKLVAQTASSQVNQGKVTSMESIVSIYDLVTDQLPKPMSTDISDPTFGQERLTTKAMRLRQVRRDEYRETAFELTDAQVSKICGPGVTWRNIRQ